jgi:hypothetical protein
MRLLLYTTRPVIVRFAQDHRPPANGIERSARSILIAALRHVLRLLLKVELWLVCGM